MDLITTTQLLGNIGEFVGAIAVVATLAYLAMQIRQNTRAVQASAIHDFLDNWRRTILQGTVQDPELQALFNRGLADFEALEDSDKARLHLYILQFTTQAQIALELSDRGFFTETERNVWVDFVASVLRTPGGTQLWKQTKHILTPNVVETLTERLVETQERPNYMEGIPFLKRIMESHQQ